MDARRVDAEDLPAVATTLAGAFRNDPAWSWVFADPETRVANLRAVWLLLLAGAGGSAWPCWKQIWPGSTP
jgi:hypothetical protein